MYIISNDNCGVCKILFDMLGDVSIPTIKASEHMDTCRRLNIKQVPALVLDDETVIFGVEEIANDVLNKRKVGL